MSTDVGMFFRELFGELDEGSTIELRAIDRHHGRRDQKFYTRVDKFVVAARKQKRPYDLYFGVHPRNGNVGTADAIKVVSCLYGDVDFKDGNPEEAARLIKSLRQRPTVVIETGHGFHVYWFFKEAEHLTAEYRPILKGLQRIVGSDPVDDPPRVLRIPGTVNYKHLDNPKEVQIRFADYSRRYVLSDFEEYRAEEDEPGRNRSEFGEKIRDGQRNRTLMSLAGTLRRRGLGEAEIHASLQAVNRSRCDPLLSDAEVESIARSATRYVPGDPIGTDTGDLGSGKERTAGPDWTL